MAPAFVSPSVSSLSLSTASFTQGDHVAQNSCRHYGCHIKAAVLQTKRRRSSFIQPLQLMPTNLPSLLDDAGYPVIPFIIRCDASEAATTLVKETLPQDDWKTELATGSVVEVWVHGDIRFAHVISLYERGINAELVDTKAKQTVVTAPVKISFGEIVSVWPESLISPSPTTPSDLMRAVDEGSSMLKYSAPRTTDLSNIYAEMRRLSKKDPRAERTSPDIAETLFQFRPTHLPDRRAALTVVTAVLLANDAIRFKRAQPGRGWRALPPSVTLARSRFSFVDACNSIIEAQKHTVSEGSKPSLVWSREQLDILRDLEIVAASGTTAHGIAATALEALGYAPNDDGAATLLLDINYWATGPVRRTSSQPPRKRIISDIHLRTGAPTGNGLDGDLAEAQKRGTVATAVRSDDKEWTFSPQLLAEARDLRTVAGERRSSYLQPESSTHGKRRRNLLHPPEGHAILKAYCVDDKSSRFLDDAISIQLLERGRVVRLCLHIADVDEIVRSGSAIDEFARERGQSLYLPLKPLHMLPAAAMDAASFSTSLPTEALTVMVEFDCQKEVVRNWEVFTSVVPPVKRVNYEQYDIALEQGARAAQLKDDEYEDLKHIARVAPLLAEKLDGRKLRRKQRGARKTEEAAEVTEERSIASVRLIKKVDKTGMRGGSRMVKVVDFQMTGSHQAVNDVLTSAGGLIRQFARENRANLPEERDAFLYVARCGTAPLRRYADLAIQRQVKNVLYGRQPAGKRRMDELRLWLAKRQSAGEKTVAERRRAALFDSFSSFCSQKCAVTGDARAIVSGQIRNVVITKRGVLRVDVSLDGTGLSMTTGVSEGVLKEILNGAVTVKETEGVQSVEKNEEVLRRAQLLLRPSCKVRVEISDVNTVSFSIQGCIVQVS